LVLYFGLGGGGITSSVVGGVVCGLILVAIGVREMGRRGSKLVFVLPQVSVFDVALAIIGIGLMLWGLIATSRSLIVGSLWLLGLAGALIAVRTLVRRR